MGANNGSDDYPYIRILFIEVSAGSSLKSAPPLVNMLPVDSRNSPLQTKNLFTAPMNLVSKEKLKCF